MLVGRVLDEAETWLTEGSEEPVSSWTAVREAFPSRGPRNRVRTRRLDVRNRRI